MPQTLNHLALDNLAKALRAAVLASDHSKVNRTAEEYVAAVAEHWTQLPAGDRVASPLPKQSLELLAWVRDMTLMQRAMTGEHLKVLAMAMRYQAARAQYQQSAALAEQ